MRITRRELLGAGAGLVIVASACGGDPEVTPRKVAPPEPEPVDGATPLALDPSAVPEQPSTRGVHAGAMTATGARLTAWADAAHTLRVWRTRASGERLLAHEARVEPAEGVLRADVTGLGAGWYEYAYFAEGDATRSAIGRFRTAHAPGDLRPLTLAGLTCTKQLNAPFTALVDSAGLGADLYLHLGDLTYADGAVTKAEYVEKYREVFADGGYAQAFGRAGYYYTWDDHEFANNLDPTTLPREQLRAAQDAAYDALSIVRDDQGRIWRSYRWGLCAEFFVVDARTERIPASRETAEATYLSPAQRAWLEQALVASPCKYKVILNSVPMARLPAGLWDFAVGDRWQGYQAERARLLAHLEANRVEGVVFVSGDFHCGFVARVEPTGWASRYLDIAVGPTGNGPNPLAVLADAGHLPKTDVFPPDVFLHGSGVWPATTAITLDPLNDELVVRFVDARPDTRGAVLYEGTLPRTPG